MDSSIGNLILTNLAFWFLVYVKWFEIYGWFGLWPGVWGYTSLFPCEKRNISFAFSQRCFWHLPKKSRTTFKPFSDPWEKFHSLSATHETSPKCLKWATCKNKQSQGRTSIRPILTNKCYLLFSLGLVWDPRLVSTSTHTPETIRSDLSIMGGLCLVVWVLYISSFRL